MLCLSPAHEQTVRDAELAARQLGIRLHVLHGEERFTQQVIAPFIAAYCAGRTPNPCIVCNPTVKFHLICQLGDELGFAHVATGHYASVRRADSGRMLLMRAKCRRRDQSYMLYRLGQHQLQKLLLPLAALEKDEVRAIAAAAGLDCAHKADSQEICFIPDNDYAAYIEQAAGAQPSGELIAPDGSVCGHHHGLHRYTVGQRKGLGVALGRPVFVRQIDPDTRRVYLAEAGGEFSDTVRLTGCVYLPFDRPQGPIRVQAKVRYAAPEAPATVYPTGEDTADVVFDSPQRAPAPGQSCVFYDGEMVVGGGFIADGFAQRHG